MTSEFRACDVHRLAKVTGDPVQDSAPRTVDYCGGCGAWICPECWTSPDLRVKAAWESLKQRSPIARLLGKVA